MTVVCRPMRAADRHPLPRLPRTRHSTCELSWNIEREMRADVTGSQRCARCTSDDRWSPKQPARHILQA